MTKCTYWCLGLIELKKITNHFQADFERWAFQIPNTVQYSRFIVEEINLGDSSKWTWISKHSLPSRSSSNPHGDSHVNLKTTGLRTDKPGPLRWRSPLGKLFGEKLAAPVCLHPKRINSKTVRITSLPANTQPLSHQHAAQGVPQPHLPGPCNNNSTTVVAVKKMLNLYRQIPGYVISDMRKLELKVKNAY